MSAPAVTVEQLHVAYGETRALDGIDIEVMPGTTLGVLGRNGAGKTTLIRVLTTLVQPTSGRATVDGLDVVADAAEIRRRIGVTGQYAGLDEFLTARENLELVGRLAGLGRRAKFQAGEMIDRLGLDDIAARRVGTLSGGSRRRVDLAASLVASPAVLFLDEPTTGLDPIARAALWDVVDEFTRGGTTVVLTTQYLEEADRLSDHIVVLNRGRVAAHGTSTELKRRVGGKIVTATIPARHAHLIPFTPDGGTRLDDERVRLTRNLDDARAAVELVAQMSDAQIDLTDLDVASPSLDDVVHHLTSTGAAR